MGPNGYPWNRVLRLTLPRRGKRFSRNTKTGRVLHALNADGLLSWVPINLPDAYRTPRDGAELHDPDIQHLIDTLKRMGAPFLATATPLWRPCFDKHHCNETLADTVAAHMRTSLPGTPHEEAQCTDALLLAVFAKNNEPNGMTQPYRPR